MRCTKSFYAQVAYPQPTVNEFQHSLTALLHHKVWKAFPILETNAFEVSFEVSFEDAFENPSLIRLSGGRRWQGVVARFTNASCDGVPCEVREAAGEALPPVASTGDVPACVAERKRDAKGRPLCNFRATHALPFAFSYPLALRGAAG